MPFTEKELKTLRNLLHLAKPEALETLGAEPAEAEQMFMLLHRIYYYGLHGTPESTIDRG